VTTISVIIPTWNRADFIEKAIRSALDQTLQPLEVLVCDDGSTDNTEQIVRSIDDKRIKWLPGDRGGRPAIPRNRGIRESRGKWIAFLDDDDVWLPEKLATQLEQAYKQNCLSSCTNALCATGTEEPVVYSLGWAGESLTFLDLLQGNRVICSSAMIHRSVLNMAVGFPEAVEYKAIEDYAFWLRVATITNFAFVDEPLILYMDSSQTSIRAGHKDPWWQKRKVLGNFLAWGCRRRIRFEFLKNGLRKYCAVSLIPLKSSVLDLLLKMKS